MIGWSISAAIESGLFSSVVVSTDSTDIAAVAEDQGAIVPFLRPSELSTDSASSLAVAIHALDWADQNMGGIDWLCLLQPTSPLRNARDIQESWSQLGEAPAIVSVCESATHPAHMFSIECENVLKPLVKEVDTGTRRQDLQQLYALNGAIYWIKAEVIRRELTFLPIGTVAYLMPPERSLDIDDAFDFDMAEWLVQREGLV